MKKNDIEGKISRAFSNLTPPDILDSVLRECRDPQLQQQKGTVLTMTNKNKKARYFRLAAGMAAAFLLVAGSVFGLHSYQIHNTVASVISLDVNPSIEIDVTQNEKVLQVRANNDDARTVIGDMDFTGSSLDVTINALIGSMLRNGYLSELSNSILISVDSSDPALGEQLQQKLADEISSLLQTETFSGSVLSQTVSDDEALDRLAQTYEITAGKARLIQEIILNDSRYTFEELAPLTINELNLLRDPDSAADDAIQTVGTASDKAYIGKEAALSTALTHAGVSKPELDFCEIDLDYEHDRMIYEIEFSAGGSKFEYEIDARSGEIVQYKAEPEKEGTHHEEAHETTGHDVAHNGEHSAAQTFAAVSITEEQAKNTAFAHAGVTAADILELECEFEDDDKHPEYEIEFKTAGYKYQYKINALTGEITEQEKEQHH